MGLMGMTMIRNKMTLCVAFTVEAPEESKEQELGISLDYLKPRKPDE